MSHPRSKLKFIYLKIYEPWNELLEMLASAEPVEKQKAQSALHLLQKDNEAYLAVFKEVTPGE